GGRERCHHDRRHERRERDGACPPELDRAGRGEHAERVGGGERGVADAALPALVDHQGHRLAGSEQTPHATHPCRYDDWHTIEVVADELEGTAAFRLRLHRL